MYAILFKCMQRHITSLPPPPHPPIEHKQPQSYEEFEFKNRYINFYQFEIFAINDAEKQRK